MKAKLRIQLNRKEDDFIRCSNRECRVILESPLFGYIFRVEPGGADPDAAWIQCRLCDDCAERFLKPGTVCSLEH